MFAMFFGSGNLVFPLALGAQCLDQAAAGTVGLLLTAVAVPFLGLIGITLYHGDREHFFGRIGRIPALILSLIILSLMGPFGVAARCIIVAYGGLELILPDVNFDLFSITFCLVTFILVWNYHRIVPIIGRVLTPWLLVGIFVLTCVGLWKAPTAPMGELSNLTAFLKGLKQGYQTMDLLAAFFFSAATIYYLKTHLEDKHDTKTLLKLSLATSFVGAGLLALVYIGFVQLGASYANQLANIHPEGALVAIAEYTLGPLAVPIASATIMLACLTTTAILVSLFAEFLNHTLTNDYLGRHPAIGITLFITYCTSRLGFTALSVYLDLALQIAYPALIALVLANILAIFAPIRISKWAFWVTLAISLIFRVLGS